MTKFGGGDGAGIVAGPDGNIWFTDNNRIGRLIVDSPTVTAITPTSGPSLGGTPITIDGTNFQTGAQVALGGSPANVTNVTATQILATTGPHAAGLVDVTVTNPDGGVGTLPSAFSYECLGTPPTASVSGTATICSGQSTNVRVDLTGMAPWKLYWSDGVQQTNLTTSPHFRSVTPSATTTYSLTAFADMYCAGAPTGSAVVTVNPTPSAVITAPAAVCLGATSNASVPDAGAGGIYDWGIVGGTIVSGDGTRQISFTAAAAGTVQLDVTVTLNGCAAVSSLSIPASVAPSATVSGGGTVCSGQSASIQASLTGTPPWSILWSDGVLQNAASSPAVRTVTPGGMTTYTITTLGDASSCPGNASGSAVVGVNPAPSAAITAGNAVCPGATGNAASVPATAGATYAWTIGNGTITAGDGTSAITWTAGAAAAVVTLGVTVTASGCSASTSRDVPITTAPNATVSGGGTVCAGSPAPVQVTLTGTAPWQITWSDGFAQTVTTSPATREVTPSAATTYTITAVTDAACTGTASGSASFAVNALPTASVSGTASICLGDEAVLTAEVAGVAPITIQWSDGEMMSGLAPGTVEKIVKPSYTTLYEITYVADANCSSYVGGSALVIVAPDPEAVAIVAPERVCAGASGIAAFIPDAGAGATYAWTITGGTITSGGATRSVTFDAGTGGALVLGVTLTLPSGCSVTGTRTLVVTAPPATPVISGPSGAMTEETGLVASVPSHSPSTYEWTIENGTITSGQGTSTITFTAGYPGTTRLTVVEVDAQGCRSTAAAFAVPVAGDVAAAIVPVVLDVEGAGGAHFTTELVLANPERVPATVDLTYTAAESLGAHGSGTVREILPPGRQLVIPDTMQYLRDKGLPIPAPRQAASGQGGSLGVTFRDVPIGASVSATARTTSPSGAGRAGLSYPAKLVRELTAASVYLFGLRQTAADRTNLALTNVGVSGTVTLRVTLRSGAAGDTRKLVLPDVSLDPGQWRQLNSVLVDAGFTNGWAQVDRVGGTEPFLAYAVFNDNVTNDGSYVPAVAVERATGTQILPVLIESSAFSSELILANPGTKSVDATLSFAESLAHPGGFFSGTVKETLQPGEQRIIPDALQFLRSRGAAIGPRGPTYAGALSVQFAVAGVAAPGFAGARTSAPASIGGQYGLFYPGVTASEMADKDAWVFGLLQDGANRTNLAIVNGAFNLGPVTVTYDIYDGTTGLKAGSSQPITLSPGGWVQVNAVLSHYGLANGYIRVERVTGEAPILVYAVVNDGSTPASGTSDGSYVSMTTPPK